MNTRELRSKTDEELYALIVSIQHDLEKLAQDIAKGKGKNTSKGRFLRKTLARIKTVLNEKKVLKEKEPK